MKLQPDNDGLRHWDFPALWKRALIVSVTLVVVSLGALVIGGLNLGIDFEGGTSFELRTDVSEADAASVLSSAVASDVRIQEVTEGTDRLLRIRSSVQNATNGWCRSCRGCCGSGPHWIALTETSPPTFRWSAPRTQSK